MHLWQRFHTCGNALVSMAARKLGNAKGVSLNQAYTGLLRLGHKLPHAGIAARRLKINFNNRLRSGFQAHPHGMKTEENFGG